MNRYLAMLPLMYNKLNSRIGLLADSASISGTLHAKTKYAANFAVQNIAEMPTKFVVANDYVQCSNDTERTSSAALAKKKEIKFYRDGYVRVKFDAKLTSNGFGGVARIYKNGVAFGTSRTITSGTYTTFSEDMYFSKNDLIQLYVAAGNDGDVSTIPIWYRNFRIGFLDDASDGAVLMNS